MRLAIVYEDNKVYVEFKPEDFLRLLKEYLDKEKDVEKAFNMVCNKLKGELLHK